MKFTDITEVCATDGIEETVDHCEEILERNPATWIYEKRVAACVKTLRDTLTKCNVPQEAFDMVNELDDSYADLETARLYVLAREILDAYDFGFDIGFDIGMLFDRIEKGRS